MVDNELVLEITLYTDPVYNVIFLQSNGYFEYLKFFFAKQIILSA